MATATSVLEASKAVATTTLIASRKTAQAALTAAQNLLDVLQKTSSTVLIQSAQASQKILTSVQSGAEWTLNQAELTLTQGPLNWFDIHEISYHGNYQDLKAGVLGNVTIKGELFNEPIVITNVTINPKQDFAALTKSFKNYCRPDCTADDR